MSRYNFYKDTCIITRPQGYDAETGDDLPSLQIYSGVCLYVEKDNQRINGQVVVSSPTLYLPKNEALINNDDLISITTKKGRLVLASAESIRDYEGEKVNGTKLILKQASEQL